MMDSNSIAIKEIRPLTDQELLAGGWERLSTMCEPRLSEMVENYESLGFEVQLLPFDVEEPPSKSAEPSSEGCSGSCNTCFQAESSMGRSYSTIYIKKPQ